MKIVILSLACCNPALAPLDRQYVERIKDALARTKVEAKVEVVSGSEAFLGLKAGYIRKLWPLFNQHGMAVAPALFIDKELVLYGGIPSVDKLVEVISRRVKGP